MCGDAPVGLRQFHQAQRLHAQDREDAGHQVEHDPADEGEEQGHSERQSRITLRRGNEPAAAPAQYAGCHVGAFLNIERERLQGAVVVGESEERRKLGCIGHPASRIHGDDRAARGEGDRLPAVLHQVAFRNEEIRISCVCGRFGCFDGDPDCAVEALELRRPVDRLRQFGAGGGKSISLRRIGTSVTHRQRQEQRRVLWYAKFVVTDHPTRAALQLHRLPGCQAFRNRDIADQQERFLVGVGDQVDEGKDMRDGKLERGYLESFREVPAQPGFEARISGVAPVGVPTRVGFKVEAYRYGAPVSGQRSLFRDQVDGGISSGDRRRNRRTGER